MIISSDEFLADLADLIGSSTFAFSVCHIWFGLETMAPLLMSVESGFAAIGRYRVGQVDCPGIEDKEHLGTWADILWTAVGIGFVEMGSASCLLLVNVGLGLRGLGG